MARPKYFATLVTTSLFFNGALVKAGVVDVEEGAVITEVAAVTEIADTEGTDTEGADIEEAADSENVTLTASDTALIISPSESFHVSLPEIFQSISNQHLVIELDQINITELVELSGNSLTYQPTLALEPGIHHLIATNDETGEMIAHWQLEVSLGDSVESSFSADTQIIASQRIAEKNIGDPAPDKFHGQANTQVSFSRVTSQWQIDGAFDLYYDSVEENRFSERAIDNGEFLMSVANQYAEAHIGHQIIGNGSFVMDNFSRRGVSVAGNIDSMASKVAGFSLSSNEIYGFGGGLGIGDSRQRVDGVYFESSPLSEQPEALTLSGTWLEGEVSLADEFIVQPTINGGGSVSQSWSLAGESLLLDDRLHMSAEYARSEFDLDRSDSFEAEQDDAYKLALNYSDITENEIAWSIGLAKQQVGTFFQSIANQGLATDKSIIQFSGSLQSENAIAEFSSETHQDNVESIKSLPTIETQLNNLALSWSPVLAYQDSWLGAPSFSLVLSEQDQVETRTPVGLTSSVANEVFSWQVSSNFAYEVNSWGINLSNTDFVDQTGFQNDNNTIGLSVFSSLVFEERATLSASIGLDQIDDLVVGTSSKSMNYALQAYVAIIPDELNLSFDYAHNKNQTSDLLISGSNTTINFALLWTVQEQAVNQFGIELGLTSSHNDFDDKLMSINSLESNQTFVTVTATLPSRLGNSQ